MPTWFIWLGPHAALGDLSPNDFERSAAKATPERGKPAEKDFGGGLKPMRDATEEPGCGAIPRDDLEPGERGDTRLASWRARTGYMM